MIFQLLFSALIYFIMKVILDNIPMSLIQQQKQVRKEIQLGITSIFWMSFPTVALFFLEVKGYSKLYDNINKTSNGRLMKKIISSWFLKGIKSTNQNKCNFRMADLLP